MTKKKLTPEERARKHEQAIFHRRIRAAFNNAGFLYLPVGGEKRKFGSKDGELDAVFLFENILLICEETITKKHEEIKTHIKNKKLLFDEINKNKDDLINWLRNDHPDKFANFDDFDDKRYQIFFLYFSKNKFNPSDDDIELYKPIKIVEQSTLNYFHKLSKNIRFSSRCEIFRFLDLNSGDIGLPTSTSNHETIDTAIICPPDATGHSESGIRIVSFMLSAGSLIRNSYVLRKDNWETHMQLYQRLIEKGRIKKIREHVATKKTTFYNNIIVSLLRKDVSFLDNNGNSVQIEDISAFKSGYQIRIPDEFNSICIIDGQHRIFAHYEGEDNLEKTIKPLRKKFHLLVTGLIFPQSMSDIDRRKYESEVFLDINSNAKPVPQDVILFIKSLRDPFSDVGIARKVLEKLNQRDVFHNMFELSLMEKSRIKIASIIKFALRHLVAINNDEDTLHHVWGLETGHSLVDNPDEGLLEEYIGFAVGALDIYFSALKTAYNDEWSSKESKILSTTSINGFVIALRISLAEVGLRDYEYYRGVFRELKVDFSKQGFQYTSSRYHQFATQILRDCFGIM